jgi:ADP-ribose pyrophosphatase
MPQSKISKSEKIFTGKIIELYQDSIVEPSGRAVVREVVRHPPAVVILPMLNQNEIILIRQYRYAVDDVLWELPAGSLEPGESVLDAAVRELEEETGYHAESVSELASFFSAPGFTDERMHLVMATNLTKTAANPDDDESIETHAISRDKVYAMFFGGDIIDAKTIVGLLIARSKQGL